MKRECYTLCGFKGQTEEALRVRRSCGTKLEGIVVASRSELRQRMNHPRRLIPRSPERHRRQIWGVGLHQQPIARHEAEEVVVDPLFESDHATERHVPTGSESQLGQRMGAGVAVQHTDDPSAPGLVKEQLRVVLRFPGVNHHGPVHLGGESDLGRERRALRLARRVVVVVVEPALADRDRGAKELSKPWNVA